VVLTLQPAEELAAEVIREARLLVGLSQEGLAERIGVPRQSIARWEGGEVGPGFDNVRRLLRSCGFDVSLVRYQAPDGYRERLLAQGSCDQYDGRSRRNRSAVAYTCSGSDVSLSTLAP
jgi:transcriptional regulator with XRE-family HTH domain